MRSTAATKRLAFFGTELNRGRADARIIAIWAGAGNRKVNDNLLHGLSQAEQWHLRSPNVPTHVLMSLIRPQEGDPPNPFEAITWHAEAFLDQLVWWTKALKTARTVQEPIPQRTPPAPAPAVARRPSSTAISG